MKINLRKINFLCVWKKDVESIERVMGKKLVGCKGQ